MDGKLNLRPLPKAFPGVRKPQIVTMRLLPALPPVSAVVHFHVLKEAADASCWVHWHACKSEVIMRCLLVAPLNCESLGGAWA